MAKMLVSSVDDLAVQLYSQDINKTTKRALDNFGVNDLFEEKLFIFPGLRELV